MTLRIHLLFKYFIFWLLYFLAVKSLFILFNFHFTNTLRLSEISGIFIHGLKMDISASTYLLVLPFLFLMLTIFSNSNRYFDIFLKWYTVVFIVLISFLVVVDCELYKYWGFRLDATPLLYINTPNEMLASVEWFVILRQLILLVIIVSLVILCYYLFIAKKISYLKNGKWYELVLFVPLFAFLIIPLRGGIGLAPLNTGTAYFCKNEFANHCGINVLWNVGYSITEIKAQSNPYEEFPDDSAKNAISTLYQKTNKKSSLHILNTDRPNVLIILIESFTAKLISTLGGEDGITPCFNRLVHEGVLFENFYSSGVRSDKGIVAVFSGFPAQPNKSIIQFPNKTESLPNIVKDFNNMGYQTAFYYGGDIDFASIRSYVNNAGFNKTISMTDFPSSTYNSKWGVHDHIVFERLEADLDSSKKPFMFALFTLSSHEPFDVPMKTVIKGDDMEQKFRNSIYYTDSCLGEFISKLKQKSWWKNTLVIITADHGARMPGNTPNFMPIRFHIPLLWLGGALKSKNIIISSVASQTDIPTTLLNQLKVKPLTTYRYSNDILDSSANRFAFFVFNNGFGLISDTNQISYDYIQNMVVLSKGKGSEKILKLGKEYMQVVYNDFINRK
jgi:phosphoglycerol transferase MdoB-like AlkP superfamily enzyme